MSSVSPPKDEVTPALFQHCVAAYNKMLEKSRPVEDNADIIVYEGYLTALIQSDLSLSIPYYTSIRKRLIEMGCVRQLRRGGGTSPSQWEMIREPTLEAFMNAEPKKVPKQDRNTAVNQQILALSRRISSLEIQIKRIFEALQEMNK